MNPTPQYYRIQSALKIIGGDNVLTCNLPLRLDPYLGCQHNCNYCYARYLLSIRNLWPPQPIPINPPELKSFLLKAMQKKLNNKVAKLIRKRFPLRIGTDTDPLQPIETKLKTTLQTLKILNSLRYPYILSTKSTLPAKDPYITLLKEAHAGAIVQITITTLDKYTAKILEPHAPPPDARLQTISKLSEENIYTQVRFSPIIPDVNSDPSSVKELFKEIRDAGAKDVIAEFLRYRKQIRQWILQASNGQIDLNKIFLKWGTKPKEPNKPAADFNGYIRIPFHKRIKMYKLYKEIARSLNLNLYVCCDGSITINNGQNCCGTSNPQITRKFPAFKLHNSAAISTLLSLFKSKKTVSLDDVKQNLFCVDWKTYEKLWPKLHLYAKELKCVSRTDKCSYVLIV